MQHLRNNSVRAACVTFVSMSQGDRERVCVCDGGYESVFTYMLVMLQILITRAKFMCLAYYLLIKVKVSPAVSDNFNADSLASHSNSSDKLLPPTPLAPCKKDTWARGNFSETLSTCLSSIRY